MSRTVPFHFLPVPSPAWQPTGEPLSLPERMVIAAMVNRWRQGHDVIAVGIPALITDTGLGETAVKAAVARLEDKGLIVKMHQGNGRGRVSAYRLGHGVLSGKGGASRPLSGVGKGSRKGVADCPKRGRETSADQKRSPGPVPRAGSGGPVGAEPGALKGVVKRHLSDGAEELGYAPLSVVRGGA